MQFRELAEAWLIKLQKRLELGKLKPASLAAFTSRVRTHAIPALGEFDVELVRTERSASSPRRWPSSLGLSLYEKTSQS